MELHENLNLKWLYKHRKEMFPGCLWWTSKILFPAECKEIEGEEKNKIEEVKDGEKKQRSEKI